MPDHSIEIHRLIPTGKNNVHYIAVCSCGRWRSSYYREREHAVTKGEAHMLHGDEHLRAIAGLERRAVKAKTELQWYEEQANDPLNSEADREMWRRLAEELADRFGGDGTTQTELPL